MAHVFQMFFSWDRRSQGTFPAVSAPGKEDFQKRKYSRLDGQILLLASICFPAIVTSVVEGLSPISSFRYAPLPPFLCPYSPYMRSDRHSATS